MKILTACKFIAEDLKTNYNAFPQTFRTSQLSESLIP